MHMHTYTQNTSSVPPILPLNCIIILGLSVRIDYAAVTNSLQIAGLKLKSLIFMLLALAKTNAGPGNSPGPVS